MWFSDDKYSPIRQKSEDYSDRRREPRVEVNMVIQITFVSPPGRPKESARVVDISEHGISFVTTHYINPGSVIRAEVAHCVLISEVRHCRGREFSKQIQFLSGASIKSVEANAETWPSLVKASRHGTPLTAA